MCQILLLLKLKRMEDKHYYKCKFCEFKTEYKRNKIRHESRKHMGQHRARAKQVYVCSYCQRRFSRKDNRQRHMNTQHPHQDLKEARDISPNLDEPMQENLEENHPQPSIVDPQEDDMLYPPVENDDTWKENEEVYPNGGWKVEAQEVENDDTLKENEVVVEESFEAEAHILERSPNLDDILGPSATTYSPEDYLNLGSGNHESRERVNLDDILGPSNITYSPDDFLNLGASNHESSIDS